MKRIATPKKGDKVKVPRTESFDGVIKSGIYKVVDVDAGPGGNEIGVMVRYEGEPGLELVYFEPGELKKASHQRRAAPSAASKREFAQKYKQVRAKLQKAAKGAMESAKHLDSFYREALDASDDYDYNSMDDFIDQMTGYEEMADEIQAALSKERW